MTRLLPLLLGAGLLASGCLAGKAGYPRSVRAGDHAAQESVPTTVSVPRLPGAISADRALATASRRPLPPAPSSAGGGSSSSYKHRRSYPAKPAPPRAPQRVVKAQPASGNRTAGKTAPAVAKGAQVPQGRLVIYRGTLVLRVFKLRDGVDLSQKLALETGAYIQSRNNNQLVIRVPVHRFHELMARLSAVGEVAGKSIAARDVTKQYFDVTHRLKAAHAVLSRLKGLLLKARNVNESLAIEREMSRLLTRIEQYKGLLRYLKHHASLSTIVVYFRVKPRYSRPIRTSWRSPFGWVKGLGVWRMMRF